MQHEGVEIGEKDYVIKGPLELFRGHVMEEMVKNEIENRKRPRFRQHKTKETAQVFYYRRDLYADEMEECRVLRKLKLTAKERVRWEEVFRKAKNYHASQ